ncbi:SIS domain-containing protein [Lactobacillus sp. IBH004]|uniref:SIS domain-containing protein n=1 Tax=Lactobacillus sp. IBH004 TaxID=2879107 RepID=UPI002244139D|nr:SIS domain-containing protein [Lactobacillus sp. IBH004]UZN41921.1 SIS domain-containing protein [Lactobacillus sp. IBH004]
MKIQDEVKQTVKKAVNKMEQEGGIKQVIWIGAGGSFGGFYGANYFLHQESKKLFSSMYTSGEFVYAPPKNLDQNSLVVLCSMRGTSETIDSAKVAKEHGATTIALYVDESDLVKVCDFKIKYESLALDESRLERVNGSIGLCIAMNLLQEVEGYDDFETAMKTFDLLDPIYRKAVDYTTPLAKEWAKLNKDQKTIYVIASGPAYGAAYVFSICNIEEMLQLNSPTIHSYEFFNGPFEVTDKSKSIFQLLATGKTRPEDERALKFEQRFGGKKLYVLDGKEIGLDDIKPEVSPYFNHPIFSSILNNVYMRELSYATHESYETRRYMWKEDYK